MEYFIESKSNSKSKRYVESLLPTLLEQLRLTKSRKMLHIMLDKDCANHGVTMDLTEMTGCYLVVLRPSGNFTELGMTLAHELVHVKQMASGLLKYGSHGAVYWRGKKYGKKIKYLDSPWEIQAFSRQELLFRRAIES